MDLNKAFPVREAADAGASLHLRHPVTDERLYDEPADLPLASGASRTPVTLTLLGADSKRWRSHANAVAQRAKSKRKGLDGMSAADAQRELIKLYAACTTGWTGIEVEGDPTFNEKNVKKLYETCPWVVEQVTDFVQDRGNFLGEGSGSSNGSPRPSSHSG